MTSVAPGATPANAGFSLSEIPPLPAAIEATCVPCPSASWMALLPLAMSASMSAAL